MAGHTPGPWKCEAGPNRAVPIVYAQNDKGCNRFSAQITPGLERGNGKSKGSKRVSDEEMAAVAYLIAASPRLLAALKDMLLIAASDDWDKATTGRQLIYKEACEAVSEAEGDQ